VHKQCFLFIGLTTVLLSSFATAEVPHLINYQGHLTNDSGEPLDAIVSMVFTIYDDSTGGTVKWTETNPSVTAVNGVFSVQLGSVILIPDSVFNGSDRWLGTTVGGDPEISPRARLISVGFAYRVSTVDGAKAGTLSGGLIIEQSAEKQTNASITVMGRANLVDIGPSLVKVAAPTDSVEIGSSSVKLSGPTDYVELGSSLVQVVAPTNSAAISPSLVQVTAPTELVAISPSLVKVAAPTDSVEIGSASVTVVAPDGTGIVNPLGFTILDKTGVEAVDLTGKGIVKAADENGTGYLNFVAHDGTRVFSDSAMTSGVILENGSGSWADLSDRNKKDNLESVNVQDLLEKVAALPITTWNYKSQDEAIRHIGPMAQDFYAAFGVGKDDKHITTIDADGVSLAAIKALYQKVKELKDENSQLKTAMKQTNQRLDKLQQLVESELAKRASGDSKLAVSQ
jgi:hypothetical protein